MQAPGNIKVLIAKYLEDTISPDELVTLLDFISSAPEQEVIMQELLNRLNDGKYPSIFTQEELASRFSLLMKGQMPQKSRVRRLFSLRYVRVAAAAILILFLAGGYYAYKSNKAMDAIRVTVHDVPPGHAGAVLTLASGEKILLDSLPEGIIETTDKSDPTLQKGALSYLSAAKDGDAGVLNTLSTPAGREFKLQLPDGTMAWLNAQSSITYPTRFSGSDRKVKVIGEVFFEVQPLANMPFLVSVADHSTVQVLGTSFNINAYDNEPAIRTTVINGLVRFGSGTASAILMPGEQGVKKIGATSTAITKQTVSTDQVIAWKNGLFNFENAGLDEVMRQLARWYDIEVIYEGNIPQMKFGGEISKDLSLKEVMNALGDAEVHFRLENGKKLVVIP